jgi:hypothetical protein
MTELSVIQKTHDLIKWYVPFLEKLPRTYKFTVGERIIHHLYELLEGLVNNVYTQGSLIPRVAAHLKEHTYQVNLL